MQPINGVGWIALSALLHFIVTGWLLCATDNVPLVYVSRRTATLIKENVSPLPFISLMFFFFFFPLIRCKSPVGQGLHPLFARVLITVRLNISTVCVGILCLCVVVYGPRACLSGGYRNGLWLRFVEMGGATSFMRRIHAL